MRNRLVSSLAFAVLSLGAVTPAGAKTVYVTATGSDANDGLTWATAKATPPGALAVAGSGDQIWVAKGTYAVPAGVWMGPGAQLYGGFGGTEQTLGARNPAQNPTILDGTGSWAVVGLLPPAQGADTSQVLDGFTITGGALGIWVDATAPTISHNHVTGNGSWNWTGGIMVSGGNGTVIRDNRIDLNTGAGDGGGVGLFYTSALVERNIIDGNTAQRQAGGVGIYLSTATVRDNLITNNRTLGGVQYSGGGALSIVGSTAQVTGNTIAGNRATEGGIIWTVLNTTAPVIANNIVAFNGSGLLNSDLAPVLDHNDVYSNGGADYVGLSVGATDISVDPLFQNADLGNYQLQLSSPCIDAGNTSAVVSGETDLNGMPRVLGAAVDMGAYETLVPSPAVLSQLVGVLVSDPAIAGALNTKLAAAQSAAQMGNQKTERNILNAFIQQVQAQTGKSISPDAARLLIQLASQV